MNNSDVLPGWRVKQLAEAARWEAAKAHAWTAVAEWARAEAERAQADWEAALCKSKGAEEAEQKWKAAMVIAGTVEEETKKAVTNAAAAEIRAARADLK